MFDNIINFFKKNNRKEITSGNSKETAKERLHLVLMQDRANVSVDFLDLMRQEIIEVIKKYIDIDEEAMDVRLTNKENEDGTQGAPALYANIPIINIKEKNKKVNNENNTNEDKEEDKPIQEESQEKEELETEKKEEVEAKAKKVKEEIKIEEAKKEEGKAETETNSEPSEEEANSESNAEDETNIEPEKESENE